MKAKLKNPYFLTPSKASTLAQGDFDFLQSYFIGAKPEQKEAMAKGDLVHNIFYDLIKCNNEIKKSNLIKPPEKWPTKAQTGINQDVYKANWHEEAKKDGKIVYSNNLEPVIEQIQIALELNDALVSIRKRGKIEFEVPLEDEITQSAGILDIKSPIRPIDVKTTSKAFSKASEFIKWYEKGFAVQQIIYEKLLKIHGIETPDPFMFLVIQLVWPFRIMNVVLDKELVEVTRKWFNLIVYPHWKELWYKLEKTFGKYPFNRPKTLKEKIDTWEKAQNNRIYDFGKIHTAKASHFFLNSTREEILKYEKEAFKKIEKERFEKNLKKS